MLLYSFIVSALIVLLGMTHLKWWENRKAILIASLVVGSLVTIMIQAWGAHESGQGKPPTYLAFVGGILAGAVPWCQSFSIRIRRVLAFSIALLFVTLVGLLVSSYHSVGITGNPKLANGRYWHTALSGQYPRGSDVGQYEQALMRCLRERVYKETIGRLKDGTEEDPQEDP